MTAPRRAGTDRTPFGAWLRANQQLDSRKYFLSICDADWIIHQYAVRTQHGISKELQNIMFVEEKQFAAAVPFSQADTLSIAGQVINHGMERRPTLYKIKSRAVGHIVSVRMWGYFCLQFSGAGPTDSEWIKWHGKLVTLQQLEEILRFQRSPLNIGPRDERSHHGGARQQTFL